MAMEQKQEVKRRFAQIKQKAISLGLTPREIARLKSLKELKPERSKIVSILLVFVVAVVAVITFSAFSLAAALKLGVLEYEGFVELWFDLRDLTMEEEPCIVDNPEYIQDIFRPPINCDLCKNVTEVGKVRNLSEEEFKKLYAYTSRPVVVQDGTKGWTAPQVFSFEFFQTIYSPDSEALHRVEKDCQFFPYQTEFSLLSEVFNMSSERANLSDGSSPWYIGWSNCESSAANALRKHYDKPYFIPSDSESSKTDWIFMGSPGYGAHMHVDAVGFPSWQAQVKGRKLWTIQPPPECYFECIDSIQIIVEPGEIIVLDTDRWYHSTLIVGDEMSIAIGSEYD
ncbi:bifunctional arginine demethylase and lysyl-hydroxylase JMJD6-like [Saccoglossus kowalevskii]|uniref:Uncharacterized protein LOC100369871 n=1 Tax=Saccoglossus kowalevskii TaxID=10224 RepID=A0ABM0GS74_SACKO|nr:PREDICTED: uncharacterized protein LOC100369871 [Saccoglossus kowalevskii]